MSEKFCNVGLLSGCKTSNALQFSPLKNVLAPFPRRLRAEENGAEGVLFSDRQYKRSYKQTRMAMRLYHRKSSASRERLDRLQVPNGIYLSNALRMQSLGACGHRDSLGLNRPRSQSLFPGSDHSLPIPPRSRSASFSGAPPRVPECTLTASEEEHIFQCYTKVMYILLGGLAAAATGLVLYGVHSFVKF